MIVDRDLFRKVHARHEDQVAMVYLRRTISLALHVLRSKSGFI